MSKGLDKLTDAIEDTLKTVPALYKDTLQPAAQEVGKFLARIPRTANASLSNLDTWILNREHTIKETQNLLEQKLENIDPDKLVAPEAYIAIPTIQAISYSMNSNELRNLYANLLAKAMNADTKDSVHPSFIEIIKQMTPIDAQIFKRINERELRPLITISIRLPNNGLNPINKNCSWIQDFSLKECRISFKNLVRLGLITIPAIGEYTDTDYYTPVTKNPLFIETEKIASQQLEDGSSIAHEKHFIELSELSLLFYDICVNDITIET